MRNLCGIDEAEGGPWAGPLSIAGVKFKRDIQNINELKFLTDSKKLTEKKRDILFDIIREISDYHIVIISNKLIDKNGISKSLKDSILEIKEQIKANEYIVDGNTSFGITNLQNMIKADIKIQEVSAASILAKVTRDKIMIQESHKYPEYNFQQHKGYGTKAHLEAIKIHGKCELHRQSYKIKALQS